MFDPGLINEIAVTLHFDQVSVGRRQKHPRPLRSFFMASGMFHFVAVRSWMNFPIRWRASVYV
jgi:hypothetical protein